MTDIRQWATDVKTAAEKYLPLADRVADLALAGDEDPMSDAFKRAELDRSFAGSDLLKHCGAHDLIAVANFILINPDSSRVTSVGRVGQPFLGQK